MVMSGDEIFQIWQIEKKRWLWPDDPSKGYEKSFFFRDWVGPMLVIVDQHSSDNRESVESLESKVAADHGLLAMIRNSEDHGVQDVLGVGPWLTDTGFVVPQQDFPSFPPQASFL